VSDRILRRMPVLPVPRQLPVQVTHNPPLTRDQVTLNMRSQLDHAAKLPSYDALMRFRSGFTSADRAVLNAINTKADKIMSQQDDITADAAAIETAVAALASEIATLKAGNPALDLTGLDKAVADLSALASPPAAPPAS
jgi:hypothetical protein